MPYRIALVFVLAVLFVTGCGRRGGLEDPSDPGSATESRTLLPGMPGSSDAGSPGSAEPTPGRPGEDAPDRPFVLDPLI